MGGIIHVSQNTKLTCFHSSIFVHFRIDVVAYSCKSGYNLTHEYMVTTVSTTITSISAATATVREIRGRRSYRTPQNT